MNAVMMPTVEDEDEFTRSQLDSLGLDEHPFRISADPKFLDLTESHKWILDHLEKSIAWREGLSVIEGSIGLGKTILARRLYDLGIQKRNTEFVYIHTASWRSNLGALRDIAAKFELRPRQAKKDMLDDFENYLIQKFEQKIIPTVIIDDAQFISAEGLTAIQDMLNFDYSAKLIQIVVFGQTEIHRTFDRVPSLMDRAVFWHKLLPLTNAEMLNMISYRLSVAGRDKPMFTDRGLKRLLEFSEGVPRRLIIVCNEAMKVILDARQTEADQADVEKAVSIYQQRISTNG